MNERYQDNRQGKEAFTKDVIAKVVKRLVGKRACGLVQQSANRK